MGVDFARLAIVISTHNRPAGLVDCADRWVKTTPDYRAMHVLVHHPDGANGFEPPPRALIHHTGRVPEHAGCMSKTWNLGMQWAFRDSEVEWCLCSMDDGEAHPGWADLVARHDYDLYQAPAGDIVFLFNRRVLREVGWFDERFPLVAYQEWDWQARAIRTLGLNRVSLDDAHGWHHNPIGLSALWRHRGDGNMPTTCRREFDLVAAEWLQRKWKVQPHEVIGMLSSGRIGESLPELEWYPWFPR